MLTADTITDEQIRDLAKSGDFKTRVLCDAALRVYYTVAQHAERMNARAKCAEILNARSKDQKMMIGHPNSGYHPCPCRDCMETAIGCDDDGNPDLCHDCEEAGCDANGEGECLTEPDPYWPCCNLRDPNAPASDDEPENDDA